MALAILGLVLVILSFIFSGLNLQTSERTNLKPIAWVARVLGVILFVGGVLYGTVRIIPAGHRGVLMRFGAVVGSLPEGMNFVIPGVNSVELMEMRTQKEESKATAASRDLQTVTTSLALNYRLDPEKVDQVYRNVGTEYVSRIIDPAVQESIKVVTAQYTAEELIKNRAQVKALVEAEITKRLGAYNILVEPAGLSITNFDFSPEFNKAIEAKQVAQQQAEQQKYTLQQAMLQQQTDIARAEGNSKAAKLNAAALQVQGGSLVIAREWIEKWDGKLPSVSAGAGGGSFIIDLQSLLRK